MFTPFAFVQEIASAPAANLLLDNFPGAAFAHSVRKLRAAYTGDCMRIVRLNDSAETDIGFVNNYIDTASISSFIGANSARVVTWYDQSGNGIDFTSKGTVGGFQVATTGTLFSLNGKFSLYTSNGYQFNMGSDSYTYNSGNELQVTTVSATDAQFATTNVFGRIFSYKNSANAQDFNNCNAFISFYGYGLSGRVGTGQNNAFANSAATAFSIGTQYIGWNYKEQGTVGVSLNAGAEATTNASCGVTNLNINRVRYGTDYLNSDSSFIGKIQEVVTWPVYTSGDKTGILDDINDFYGAY